MNKIPTADSRRLLSKILGFALLAVHGPLVHFAFSLFNGRLGVEEAEVRARAICVGHARLAVLAVAGDGFLECAPPTLRFDFFRAFRRFQNTTFVLLHAGGGGNRRGTGDGHGRSGGPRGVGPNIGSSGTGGQN